MGLTLVMLAVVADRPLLMFGGLGIGVFVMSLPVAIAGVYELAFIERIAGIKCLFAMTFIGIMLYSLITFPGNRDRYDDRSNTQ